MLLVATVALWVADAVDWMPDATASHWSGLTLKAALITLGLALLGRVLSPLARMKSKGRCVVCGRTTERGHAYCQDHLLETVHHTLDQTRSKTRSAPRPQPQAQPRS